MLKHFLVGALCLVCWTLPWDLTPGPDPAWVVPVSVLIGIAGALASAAMEDRRRGRRG